MITGHFNALVQIKKVVHLHSKTCRSIIHVYAINAVCKHHQDPYYNTSFLSTSQTGVNEA
jgi:hypothetical protein